MKLWAHIKGKDYPINYGSTFSDELSETLDSGSITIPHEGIIDIKPFDDVIIHDKGKSHCPNRPTASISGGVVGDLNVRDGFYRHFLISTITRDRVVIGKDIFNYKISLFSETKGLENVQLPNRTITNPKEGQGEGRTIWEWMCHFVGEYSPKQKILHSGNRWSYVLKYRLDRAFEPIFSSLAPEQQWNLPTLKDVLHSLSITKGYIPTVKDGIITFMSLTTRGNPIDHIPSLSWDTWVMDSSQYCDRLRKTYTNSLSKDGTTILMEKLSFRNSGSPTMDLSDMKLEFSHPIYRIRKMKMCYLAKKMFKKAGDEQPKTYVYCVKQDITKLVITSQERNLMNVNWKMFKDHPPLSVDEMAKYKLCTIGYNIGSTTISGWGERYSYPVGWWQNTKTYLENILTRLWESNPYGSYTFGEDSVPDGTVITFDIGTESASAGNIDADIVAPSKVPEWFKNNDVGKLILPFLGSFASNLKNIFFECEYEGYVQGTVIASKDFHDGDVVKNDNQANSLSIVETEGFMTKEKVNRLGNASITKTARLNANLDGMLSLGDYFEDENEIMYKRSVTIDKDHAVVNYYFCKNFILQNYFSSVYSRHRPFPLASAEESTTRSENRTLELLLSPKNSYYSKIDSIQFTGGGSVSTSRPLMYFIENVSSFWRETPYDDKYATYDFSLKFRYAMYCPNEINVGLDLEKSYMTDMQMYVAGTSLCISMKMVDNITAGISRIVEYNPFENESENWLPDNLKLADVHYKLSAMGIANILCGNKWFGDVLSGSTQKDYYLTEDTQTGFLGAVTFGAVSVDQAKVAEHYYETGATESAEFHSIEEAVEQVYDDGSNGLLRFPKYPYEYDSDSPFEPLVGISSTFGYKDGKEKIESTFQIEPICEKGIAISPYFMQLSDLVGTFAKNTAPFTYRKGMVGISSGSYSKYREFDASGDLTEETSLNNVPFINLFFPSESIIEPQTELGTNLDLVRNFTTSEIGVVEDKDISGEEWVRIQSDYEFTGEVRSLKIESVGDNYLDVSYSASYKIRKKKVEALGSGFSRIYIDDTDSGYIGEYTSRFIKLTDDNFAELIRLYGSAEQGAETIEGNTYGYPLCNTTKVGGYDCYTFVMPFICPKDADDRIKQYFPWSGVSLSGYSVNDMLYSTQSVVSRVKKMVQYKTSSSFKVGKSRNVKTVIAPKIDERTPYDFWGELPLGFSVVDNSTEYREENGKPTIHSSATFEDYPWSEGSIRMYFYDDRDAKWHFVWGQDFDNPNRDVSVDTVCYLSLLDDRSKTVYDPNTGDPCASVLEYNSHPEVEWGIDNYCVVENPLG